MRHNSGGVERGVAARGAVAGARGGRVGDADLAVRAGRPEASAATAAPSAGHGTTLGGGGLNTAVPPATTVGQRSAARPAYGQAGADPARVAGPRGRPGSATAATDGEVKDIGVGVGDPPATAAAAVVSGVVPGTTTATPAAAAEPVRGGPVAARPAHRGAGAVDVPVAAAGRVAATVAGNPLEGVPAAAVPPATTTATSTTAEPVGARSGTATAARPADDVTGAGRGAADPASTFTAAAVAATGIDRAAVPAERGVGAGSPAAAVVIGVAAVAPVQRVTRPGGDSARAAGITATAASSATVAVGERATALTPTAASTGGDGNAGDAVA